MEFFIKQNTNLPILKMDAVKDGRTDVDKEFYSKLDNATIRFSMKNEENGAQKIFMKSAYIVEKTKTNPYVPTGSTDPTGTAGTISWSGNTLYFKNNTGWVRITGQTSW